MKTCAIIVTFNRKTMLQRCIKAVLCQTHTVDSLFIVDNASTDNTFEHLIDNNLISQTELLQDELLDVSKGQQQIFYYRSSTNIGGAGGFYTGLKLAHEKNLFNAFWLMDDDGYPSESCLEQQLKYLEQFHYVMPTSIDIENGKQLSWATKMPNKQKTILYEEYTKVWGSIMPFVFPFNGCLFSEKLVSNVGYINPQLFIWGDDYEHYFRCLKKGFKPITLTHAKFYHPANKAQTHPIMNGIFKIPYVESELRFLCLIRNWAYINKKNHRYFHLMQSFVAYTWLFLITKQWDLKSYKFYLSALADGLIGNFTRHVQYIK